MSLISITVPSSGEVLKQEVVKAESDCQFDNFEALDDEFGYSDMEGSIINRPRPKKAHTVPAVPMRSSKRASKVLDSLMPDLQSLDGSIHQELHTEETDPHKLYLSSEEDASLSDDYDDDDSLMDFEPSPVEGTAQLSPPASRSSSRKSQEDTARIVSFVVVKPQIIEICSSSPSPKKETPTLRLRSAEANIAIIQEPNPRFSRRPPPLTLYPSATHRLSVASVSSTSVKSSLTRSSTMPLPLDSSTSAYLPQKLPHESTSYIAPRKAASRMTTNLSSLVTNTKHAFLSSDPFAESSTENTPVTPKTPISMAAAAWRTGLSRTLSKARKQSVPKLSAAYAADAASLRNQSRISLTAEAEETEDIASLKLSHRASTTLASAQRASIRGDSVAKAPESKEKDRKMSLGMRGLSRQKSVRGRDRFLG